MNSVQADGAFGSPHVEAHGEAMRDVVMHSLFDTTTELCQAKVGKRGGRYWKEGNATPSYSERGLITAAVSKDSN